MVAIRRSSHAYFFDGVSDSVIVPQGRFNNVGQELPEGPYSAISILGESPHGTKDLTQITKKGTFDFAIEAWVIPDCGGVIASCKDKFKLELKALWKLRGWILLLIIIPIILNIFFDVRIPIF